MSRRDLIGEFYKHASKLDDDATEDKRGAWEIEQSTKYDELNGLIVLFACYKAVHAQDSCGMSWYDDQFGHMPWLYDEECDDEEIANRVRNTRGAYGVPLSCYGSPIFNRTHPDYWWR